MKSTALCFALSLILSARALSLGMDTGTQPAVQQEGWPKGAVDLANHPGRVAGHWVNQSDVFFFAGDTAVFNAFLARYAALSGEETPHILTIQPGPGVTTKLGEKEPKIHYDWFMEISRAGWDGEQHYNPDPKIDRFPVRVRITLATGGAVELKDIALPANIDLKTKSAEEIEAWVMRQRAKRLEQTPLKKDKDCPQRPRFDLQPGSVTR